jgi:hypothetical protein
MGNQQMAALEFAKTKSLTKSADDSVFSKLKKSDVKKESAEETGRTNSDK